MHKIGRRTCTAKVMAARLKISVSTIKKYTSVPIDEYLANCISRIKPWEELGISRATWYRRKKKDQLDAKVQN